MGANLKEVRERISSVKSTQQITKAMKMVSASKLRRAQQAITQLRPYANKLNDMLVNILSNLEGDASTVFGQHREVKNAMVVVVTSNRGLCGAFNTNVIKAAVHAIETKYAAQRDSGNLTILCVGKKGYDYFKKRFPEDKVIADYVGVFSDLSFDNIGQISQRLMDVFEAGEFDAIDVAYGRFKNAGMQFPELFQFLPVEKLEPKAGASKLKSDYIFEPDKESLLTHLVPTILQTKFQSFLLDTHASEHGARMTAMDAATDNAEELIKGLKITYNKARQEAITKELSEIVGGAAALESS
ncbi:MAG: F-type H+-transporting ATPase subunit gamma [Saprospiraceae bacterium]|jgi:F-type H+-transporting ATPase subunit gamma